MAALGSTRRNRSASAPSIEPTSQTVAISNVRSKRQNKRRVLTINSSAFVASTPALSSAARTETIVCTRGGRENSQRNDAAAVRQAVPRHAVELRLGAPRELAAPQASGGSAATRLRMKRSASSGVRDHAIPGKA